MMEHLSITSFFIFLRDIILGVLSFFIEFVDRPIQTIFGDNLSSLRQPYWLPKEVGNIIITGGTTGLGKETARYLARIGYRVIITGNDDDQGKQAAVEIRDETGNPNVEFYMVDHASFASVRSFAEKINERDLQVHILINNAGGMNRERIVTDDGMEKTFQVNYAAHFLLTHLLLENIKKANPPGRIINVASFMHWFGRIKFGDLMSKKWYFPSLAYCDTKLAMILFTRELQKKLASEGRKDILAVAVHPGSVDTALKEGYPEYMRLVSSLLFKTANWGARTHLYCALASPRDLVPGQYYVDTAPLWVSSKARDPKLALRLWMETEKLLKSSE